MFFFFFSLVCDFFSLACDFLTSLYLFYTNLSLFFTFLCLYLLVCDFLSLFVTRGILQRLKEVNEGQTRDNAEAFKWYLLLNMNFCKSTSPGIKAMNLMQHIF